MRQQLPKTLDKRQQQCKILLVAFAGQQTVSPATEREREKTSNGQEGRGCTDEVVSVVCQLHCSALILPLQMVFAFHFGRCRFRPVCLCYVAQCCSSAAAALVSDFSLHFKCHLLSLSAAAFKQISVTCRPTKQPDRPASSQAAASKGLALCLPMRISFCALAPAPPCLALHPLQVMLESPSFTSRRKPLFYLVAQ